MPKPLLATSVTDGHLPWVEKYRPRQITEIAGHNSAIVTITQWLKKWTKGIPQKRALLITGPTGVGKTSAVHAIANSLDLELFELNASEVRNKERIQKLAGGAAFQTTLTGDPTKLRLILMDEADGLSGTQDRGGIQALTDIVKETLNPIIITASNKYNPRLTTLKKYSIEIKFHKVRSPSIRKRIAQILGQEKIYIDKEALDYLATNAEGDLRAAITDLQILAAGLPDPQTPMTLEFVQSLLSPRDTELAVFQTLVELFKATTVVDALRIQRRSEINYDMLQRWISENLPLVFTDVSSRYTAYQTLARSDLHMRRARYTGNWSLLSYGLDLLVAGVPLSQYVPLTRYIPFKFPTWIQSLSRGKSTRLQQDELSAHIGKQLHVGKRIARDAYLPMITYILKRNKDKGKAIIQDLTLSKDMVDFLVGKGAYKRIMAPPK